MLVSVFPMPLGSRGVISLLTNPVLSLILPFFFFFFSLDIKCLRSPGGRVALGKPQRDFHTSVLIFLVPFQSFEFQNHSTMFSQSHQQYNFCPPPIYVSPDSHIPLQNFLYWQGDKNVGAFYLGLDGNKKSVKE